MSSTCLFRKRAFTLVELLVVVLILGILMAMALPSFLSSTNQAKFSTANAHARAIAQAVQSDYVRSGGDSYLPYASSPLRNDADVMADLGGRIPDNPCSPYKGLGGYGITATSTKWTIVPYNDLCPGVNKIVIKLGN